VARLLLTRSEADYMQSLTIQLPMLHQRLLNEATYLGADKILQQLPADLRPTLEQSIHQAVHEAVLHYVEGMQIMSRQLYPLRRDRSRV
jgi:hypothetical protein